ncbi:hypothetical protein NDU88_005830 [Pleurodeles waltl]|uniref:Uncharacterized protein n=1 Tax=Pleurodeles waltl TaxID=8319 RepID=A0AAV7VL33_PLEWA|nr:hypothetical protein NDU88_005830 [Pleurodeles waltl]
MAVHARPGGLNAPLGSGPSDLERRTEASSASGAYGATDQQALGGLLSPRHPLTTAFTSAKPSGLRAQATVRVGRPQGIDLTTASVTRG